MNLRTELTLPRASTQIGLQSRVVTVGSCFADVLGAQLVANKIETLTNPFGTTFNPVSIGKHLSLALYDGTPDEVFFVKRDDIWLHHDFHSSFWNTEKTALHQQIVESLRETKKWLLTSKFLVVTLGTAWAYWHTKHHLMVSNCHKMPSQLFEKRLLGVGEIENSFADLFQQIRAFNPDIEIVLTVSPVRHTRDTLQLNAVSKAVLRLACHQIASAHERVSYFPSYEIMLDDLRDYRFYKPDLIHPNEVAEQYIFEKFGDVYFEAALTDFVSEWAKIRTALAHRPTSERSESYRTFLQNLLLKLEKNPFEVDLTQEIAEVRAKRIRAWQSGGI